jgi:hypothetical protein
MKYKAFSQTYTYNTPVLASEVTLYPPGAPEDSSSLKVIAVWDTGAVRSFVSNRVGELLDLKPTKPVKFTGGTGTEDGFETVLACRLSNGLFIPDKKVVMAAIATGDDILIGMDLIGAGDFHISHNGGKTLFSFVIPAFPKPINLELEAERLNSHSL